MSGLNCCPSGFLNLHPQPPLSGTCQALEVNKIFYHTRYHSPKGQLPGSCQGNDRIGSQEGGHTVAGTGGRTLLEGISPSTPSFPSPNVLAIRAQKNS